MCLEVFRGLKLNISEYKVFRLAETGITTNGFYNDVNLKKDFVERKFSVLTRNQIYVFLVLAGTNLLRLINVKILYINK